MCKLTLLIGCPMVYAYRLTVSPHAYTKHNTYTSIISQHITSLRYKAYMNGLRVTITGLHRKAYTIQAYV